MKLYTKFITGAALLVVYAASASALTISPSTTPLCDASGFAGTNGGPDSAFMTYCATTYPGDFAGAGTATQVYKNDFPGGESGSLSGSYASVGNGGLSGGTITWTGPSYLLCTPASPCFLLVKDGNNSPYRYLFNLTTPWDGQETLTLQGFWPTNGGISHWALYGATGCCDQPDDNVVPEPGTLALLGLGLMGLGLSRRRMVK